MAHTHDDATCYAVTVAIRDKRLKPLQEIGLADIRRFGSRCKSARDRLIHDGWLFPGSSSRRPRVPGVEGEEDELQWIFGALDSGTPWKKVRELILVDRLPAVRRTDTLLHAVRRAIDGGELVEGEPVAPIMELLSGASHPLRMNAWRRFATIGRRLADFGLVQGQDQAVVEGADERVRRQNQLVFEVTDEIERGAPWRPYEDFWAHRDYWLTRVPDRGDRVYLDRVLTDRGMLRDGRVPPGAARTAWLVRRHLDRRTGA